MIEHARLALLTSLAFLATLCGAAEARHADTPAAACYGASK